MEAIGTRLRQKRMRLGLTLDELAGRTGISKPYLSLIETGRVPNPPSDEKLRRLERVLGFAPGDLVMQAHIERTPRDVRAVLEKLLRKNPEARGETTAEMGGATTVPAATEDEDLSALLQELVGTSGAKVERVMTNAVPVLNRPSAGYPKDLTDLTLARGVAEDYLGCPEVSDPGAFAARVHGDSMTPKYAEGDIVVFSPAASARHGDDCFVLFADGHTTFMRVFFEADTSGAAVIRLQPRNERYRPEILGSEEVRGLYRAVYRYHRVNEE